MSANREVLDLECQLRFVDLADAKPPFDTSLDLFIDGFWEGVRAAAKPRSLEVLQGLLEMRRARASRLIKQETPCETPIPNPSPIAPLASESKRPRRRPSF